MQDLTQAGIMVEPFFIATEDKPFDQTRFYSVSCLSPRNETLACLRYCCQDVLLPTNVNENEYDPYILPEAISITRIDDLLAQMRFHEVPKRAQFSVPFELANGFIIGVKGFVTSGLNYYNSSISCNLLGMDW